MNLIIMYLTIITIQELCSMLEELLEIIIDKQLTTISDPCNKLYKATILYLILHLYSKPCYIYSIQNYHSSAKTNFVI